MLAGSQKDPTGHNCVIDGGYQWCDVTQIVLDFGKHRVNPLNDCSESCPPPMPCPEPYIPNINNCRMVTNYAIVVVLLVVLIMISTGCVSDSDCRSNQFCRPTQTYGGGGAKHKILFLNVLINVKLVVKQDVLIIFVNKSKYT